MAAADKITVTGVVGPGVTVTSKVVTGVDKLEFDMNRQILTIIYDSTKRFEVDMYTLATVTYTIAARVATVVVATA